MKHPITATNTALSTPPSGRRFCKLLTPETNPFGLTKVNIFAQRIENQYHSVHVLVSIEARNRHFVNPHATKHLIFEFCILNFEFASLFTKNYNPIIPQQPINQ
jgi:hypothetical protein